MFFLPVDPRDESHKDPEKLTSLHHIERDKCTVHGMSIKTRYFGLILSLRLKRNEHSIRLDRMQLSFREHFQLIVFQKL